MIEYFRCAVKPCGKLLDINAQSVTEINLKLQAKGWRWIGQPQLLMCPRCAKEYGKVDVLRGGFKTKMTVHGPTIFYNPTKEIRT